MSLRAHYAWQYTDIFVTVLISNGLLYRRRIISLSRAGDGGRLSWNRMCCFHHCILLVSEATFALLTHLVQCAYMKPGWLVPSGHSLVGFGPALWAIRTGRRTTNTHTEIRTQTSRQQLNQKRIWGAVQ